MSTTNIEYFNNYLKMFVNSIKETFPEYNEVLDNYYENLLNNEQCNEDKHVKRLMQKKHFHSFRRAVGRWVTSKLCYNKFHYIRKRLFSVHTSLRMFPQYSTFLSTQSARIFFQTSFQR